MSYRVSCRALVAACGLTSAACGPWIPLPQPGTHDGEAPVVVPSAPPTPQVEIIPERPKDAPDIVWIDGQWLWRGRRWEWEKGDWVVPRPGARYAPPVVVYLSDGRIAWFAGHFHAPAGR